MEQSQLVELIRILKPEERAQILHFAAIPFFNNGRMRDQVVPLLDVCLGHPLDFSGQRLEKSEVYAIVFPGQEVIAGKLEKVMVEAHKVVKSFLLTQRYFREGNEFNQLLDFSEELRLRGLNTRFQQTTTKLQKMQSESIITDAQFYRRQYLLEASISNEESIRNQAKGNLNFPNTLHALELDFYLNRLVILNHFLLQQKIAHLDFFEEINLIINESNVPERYLNESAVIKINYQIFLLLKKEYPTPTEVQGLFELLLLHEKSIDSKMLLEFYTYLRNLCVLSLTADYEQVEMYNVLNKLYKDNLQRGYLHFEGKINRTRYWAVSSNAIYIGDLDWALEFIEKYKNEIRDENETKDIYRLNLANYLFAKGKYSECLDNIPESFSHVDYLLHSKRLELKSYYELRSDLLPYKLDAFKMFLSRTSPKLLSATQRQIHSDFANLLHQIVYSNPGNSKRPELLIKRIHEKKQSAEWRWLLEKAKALKPG